MADALAASPLPFEGAVKATQAAIDEAARPGRLEIAAPEGSDPIAQQIAAEQRGEALPPDAPPDVDPLAAQIAQEQQREDAIQAQMLQWRDESETTDPGRRADVLRYAAASGFAPEFVDQHLDKVKRKVDAGQVDWAEVGFRQPALARVLTDQPELQPVVRDDVANLGGVEWAIKAPFHAFWDAVNEQRAVGRQFLEAHNLGSEENRQQIRALEEQYANKDYGAENIVSKGIVGAAKMLPFLVGDIAARAAGGAAGKALGGLAGPESAGVGGALGQYAASGLFNYYESVGPLYWRLSSLRDADGKPLDPAVARSLAQGASMINGVLMAGLLGKVGGSLPGVKQILAKTSGATIEKALAQQTVTRAIKRAAMQYGGHVLSGAVVMSASSAINQATEEAAKSRPDFNSEAQWANVGSAAADGFVAGLEDMWLLAATGPGRELLHEVGRARASAESAARLEAMTKSAGESKLLERFPEGFKATVRKMKAEDGGVENVYVPAEEWTRYWQEKQIDPGEMAEAVGAKGFAEAVATKGDLVIPVEEYLAKLARTEHAAGLAPDARLRPDEPTPREFAAEQERTKQRMEEEGKVRGAEIEKQRSEVFEVIRSMAEAAGIAKVDAESNAEIVSQYASTLALRMGVSVQEAAARAGLGRLRILGPKGVEAAEKARESFLGSLALEQQLGDIEGTRVTLDMPPAELIAAQESRDNKGPRGFINYKLDPTGRPIAFDINVLNGDRSTLAHETAHFLSWSLHDVALSDRATPEIRADYEGLLKFAGYKSVEERLAANQERASLLGKSGLSKQEKARLRSLSAKEERISHAWEQYLAEGKAPSEALARVFSRFKRWMAKIYKGIDGIRAQFRQQYGEDINLSPEVRGIFDRLLAGDDAIEQARRETGADVAPPPEMLDSMSPAEREAYQRAIDEARQHADREMAQRVAEIEGERIDEERTRIRAEATAEVDQEPVHRATRYLQRGELAGDGRVASGGEIPDVLLDNEGKPYKLNRAEFVKQYGADVARKMPPGIFDATKKGGVKADDIAPLLGFESGEDLVAGFQTEHRDAAIERITQERLDERYGPALQAINEAAMSAVHSDSAAHATLLELRALAKLVSPEAARRVQTLDLTHLHATAERIVGETAVGEINPSRHQRAERAAAIKAAELWGKGEKEKALEQREARLLNQVLYIEARDRKARIEKARERLRKTNARTMENLGKADPSYRDVHEQILEAVGLADVATTAERQGLDAALERAKLDFQEMDFNEDGIRALLAQPKRWERLTADEAENVIDAIDNLRTAARRRNEVTLAGKKQAKDEWFAEFQEKISTRKPVTKDPYSTTARSRLTKAKGLGRGADAILSDMETIAYLADGGDRNGPMHRMLVDGRLEARRVETDLAHRVLKVVVEKWGKVPKGIRKLRNKRVDVAHLLPVPKQGEETIAPIYTRDQLWMLFLNWGNEGNRQRIRDGNGWADADVEKALALLSPEEREFLQGILDATESLYPELARVYEGRTGRRLEKVAATPILVDGEEHRGGYWPLRYDSRFSKQGEVQEADVVANLFQPNYVKPTPASGHTKARQQKVFAPVSLEWGVVPAHFAQVIHDIAYGDWVRQAGTIMLDERFKALAKQYLGPEFQAEFIPWLRDVANARADSAAGMESGLLRTLGSFARSRIAATILGFNLPNQVQGLLDPQRAVLEGVKLHHLEFAHVKLMNPGNWGHFEEFKLSKELHHRGERILENMRRTFAEAGPVGHGITNAVTEAGFKAYELTDAFSTRVVFKAMFDQSMGEGFSREEAAARADDVVRRLFPTQDVAERPAILRSKRGLAAILLFQTWANRNYNILRRRHADAAMAWGDAGVTGKAGIAVAYAARWIYFGLVAGAAGAYVAGRGPRKDEDETSWLMRKALLEGTGTVPLVGPALESIVTGDKASARGAPEVSLIQDVIDKVGDAMHKAQSGSATDAEKALASAAVLTAVLGGPTGQVVRTGGFLQQVADRKAKVRGPADIAKGIVYGKTRKNSGSDPLTDIQDALAESGR